MTGLGDAVREILERQYWVACAIAAHLGEAGPIVASILAHALDGPAPARSVAEWASRCSAAGRATSAKDLQRLFRVHTETRPKPVLDRLRLAAALAYAASHGPLTRERLARRYGYRSGDDLGRQAGRLTGLPLGRIKAASLGAALRLLGQHASSQGRS